MPKSFIIFDLDGTLSDPKEGIVRSIKYALEAHGFDSRSEAELLTCIGPPLDASFRELLETADKSLVSSLVKKISRTLCRCGVFLRTVCMTVCLTL